MNRRAGILVLIAVSCAFAARGLSAQSLDTGEGDVSIETEKTDVAGLAAIEVHSSVAGSTVSINRVDAGYTPFSAGSVPPGGQYTAGVGATGVNYTIYQNDSLPPGSYLIGVAAPGYYKREISLILDEKTKYYFYFTLTMISGTLDLQVTPPDAAVLVDDHPASAGQLTLPVGQHNVTVRRFGYVERRISALVREKETTGLSVDLAVASFSVSPLVSSRSAFNPINAGVFGRVDLRFRVESFGSARLSLTDDSGTLVASQDFPSFDTWDQHFTWTGRDSAGAPLPDGSYTARLEARPAASAAGSPGIPGSTEPEAIVRETSVRIDSSLVLLPRGTLSAIPGLLFFADPRGEPAGTGSAEFSWLSPTSNLLQPSFALSGAVSLNPRIDVAFGAAAENLASISPGVDFALALRYGLWSQAPQRGSAGALFLRGTWSDASSGLLPSAASAIELSIPLALGIGPLQAGLEPGLRLDLSSSSPVFGMLTRAGLWASGSVFRAGFSAELDLEADRAGLVPAWPLDLGLDLRMLLAPSPLELSVVGLGALSPHDAATFSFGLGLGLLF